MPVAARVSEGLRATPYALKLSCDEAGGPPSLIEDSIEVRVAGKSGVASE